MATNFNADVGSPGISVIQTSDADMPLIRLESWNYNTTYASEPKPKHWGWAKSSSTAASGSLTRPNGGTCLGYNCKGDGTREDTGDVSLGLRQEEYYNPAGTQRWLEQHLFADNGTQYRAIGLAYVFPTAASDSEPTIAAAFKVSNALWELPDGTDEIYFDLVNGPFIRFEVNNNTNEYGYIRAKRGSSSTNPMVMLEAYQDEIIIGTTGGVTGTGNNTGLRTYVGGSKCLEIQQATTNRDLYLCPASGAVTYRVGAFGVVQARPAAYTQTYSTASRTHAALTYVAPDASAVDGTYGAEEAAVIGSLRTQLIALAADLTNVKQVLNQVIDDHQGYGWLA